MCVLCMCVRMSLYIPGELELRPKNTEFPKLDGTTPHLSSSHNLWWAWNPWTSRKEHGVCAHFEVQTHRLVYPLWKKDPRWLNNVLFMEQNLEEKIMGKGWEEAPSHQNDRLHRRMQASGESDGSRYQRRLYLNHFIGTSEKQISIASRFLSLFLAQEHHHQAKSYQKPNYKAGKDRTAPQGKGAIPVPILGLTFPLLSLRIPAKHTLKTTG